MFTRPELDDAARIVARSFAPTPQYRWPLLSQRTGCDVWVKHENHTPTGAFKVRGGLLYVDELQRVSSPGKDPRTSRPAGLITATRGNHGQSIPYAASRYDLPVMVLVPEGNSPEKNLAMQAWGAEVVVFGKDFDEARVEAYARADQLQLEIVPAYHPALVRGVATYALELFTAVPDLKTVYVPIGMGSGISGLIGVRDLLGLSTEVVGVVSESADAVATSFETGTLTETQTANTFADGMACRVPDPEALEIIRSGAARIVRVSDDEVAAAMRAIYTDTHNVAEGAGAAGYAALLQERESQSDQRVAVILTGGNVDASVFASVLRGETPMP
jgi:threonine dehydratase